MKNQQLCVVFRATEAGECIARHLHAIDNALDWDFRLDHDKSGECRLVLPSGSDEGAAQRVADQLNDIMDESGRPVLEAEMAFLPAGQAAAISSCH